jgi:hypothetical protein
MLLWAPDQKMSTNGLRFVIKYYLWWVGNLSLEHENVLKIVCTHDDVFFGHLQSERKVQELWSQLAIEEQSCFDTVKTVKELVSRQKECLQTQRRSSLVLSVSLSIFPILWAEQKFSCCRLHQEGGPRFSNSQQSF